MRLWTIHPKYLDAQGLVTLWREALLARAVLRGRTKGYRHHPQLQRFKASPSPLSAINFYLATIRSEASRRGYEFDASKIGPIRSRFQMACTSGQLDYEWQHLVKKLRKRSSKQYRLCRSCERPESHPLFRICAGAVEPWERIPAPRPLSRNGRGDRSQRGLS
jgi:hypothetical protein